MTKKLQRFHWMLVHHWKRTLLGDHLHAPKRFSEAQEGQLEETQENQKLLQENIPPHSKPLVEDGHAWKSS